MKIYLVGGAVRDEIMGVDSRDRDYVVVGSTPEQMLALGYKQVGGDFPVFIHPDTNDEYALARTEFKEGHGYQGFNVTFGPDVTLEDDLLRRDLTINAIAKDLETGEYIDPFGGVSDIRGKVFDNVSDAFSDDPVRALRVARLSARYPEFKCSMKLLKAIEGIRKSGELDHVTPERIWKETERSLGEVKPSKFFRMATALGIFPELAVMRGVNEPNKWHPEEDIFEHIMLSLDVLPHDRVGWHATRLVRFGVLCHDFGKVEAYEKTGGLKSSMHEKLGVPIVSNMCDRLKIPNEYRRLGMLCAEYHTHCHISFDMKPKTLHKLFKRFKGLREFRVFVMVAECDKMGRGIPACDWPYPQSCYISDCYYAYLKADTKSISAGMPEGPAVGEAIRRAEIAAIASVDKEVYQKPYDEFMKTI